MPTCNACGAWCMENFNEDNTAQPPMWGLCRGCDLKQGLKEWSDQCRPISSHGDLRQVWIGDVHAILNEDTWDRTKLLNVRISDKQFNYAIQVVP